jgi:peptidoglycan/xylan/chitin deacetylase (PgdA/CDA1 family)
MSVVKRIALFLISLFLMFSTSAFAILGNANADSTNLVANPSLETSTGSTPSSWLEGNWGTNTTNFSYLNTGHTGSHSVEVQMSNYSSGDAKWYFSPVAVSASTNYNFSDYYESNVSTEVVVQFTDAQGNDTYLDLGPEAASTSWAQASLAFVAPSNVASMTVFHLIQSNGYLITDDYSVTSNTAPAVNITAPTANATLSGTTSLTANASASDGVSSVQFQLDGQNIGSPLTSAPYSLSWNSTTTSNGSHGLTAIAIGQDGSQTTSAPVVVNVSNATTSTGNIIPNANLATPEAGNTIDPSDWTPSSWGTNTVSFNYLNTGYDDTNSVNVDMTSYSSGDAKWFFTPQNVQPDTQYKFSEYYKSTVQTQVMAVFNLSDGSIDYEYIGLPDTASSWTQFSTTFSIPEGTSNMTIYHLINQVGSLTTDDFSMTPYTPTGFKEPLVSLTFDDGYLTTYKDGLPVLQKYGYDSTQFIITDLVGTSGYMTKADIKTLYADKQEIASHTVTHDDMTQESASTLTTELSQSQTKLDNITGFKPTDIAYPYGLYNTAVQTATKSYYTGARGVEDGLNSKDNFNAYDLKVQNVYDTTTTAQVADWVKQAQTTDTWLILVYHAVDPNNNSTVDGGEYNVTPTQLTAQLAAIKASGIKVETMQAALTETESQL